jgi:hypothetical protein
LEYAISVKEKIQKGLSMIKEQMPFVTNVRTFDSNNRWFESDNTDYTINIRMMPQGAFIDFRSNAHKKSFTAIND